MFWQNNLVELLRNLKSQLGLSSKIIGFFLVSVAVSPLLVLVCLFSITQIFVVCTNWNLIQIGTVKRPQPMPE